MTRSTDTWPKVISNRMFIIVFVIYVAFLRLVMYFLFFYQKTDLCVIEWSARRLILWTLLKYLYAVSSYVRVT